MSRSKDIGTRGESAVVAVLRTHGFPGAERAALNGSADEGDVTGTPGICWEVKSGKAAENASDGQVTKWLAEVDVECVNRGADIGVLVMKRRGIGHGNADRWWAVLRLADLIPSTWGLDPTWQCPLRMTLADACRVLVHLGYGHHPIAATKETP